MRGNAPSGTDGVPPFGVSAESVHRDVNSLCEFRGVAAQLCGAWCASVCEQVCGAIRRRLAVECADTQPGQTLRSLRTCDVL